MEKEEINHSFAYYDLKKQIKAVGYERKDGYNNRVLEEVYDWERNEVEELIWNKFQQDKDLMLIEILPKLKKYDGIKMLKETLFSNCMSREVNMDMAKTLYEYTKDKKYLDILTISIDCNDYNNIHNFKLILDLNKFPVTEDLYKFFRKLYFKCEAIHSSFMQEIIRGLLRCKKDNIKSFGITRKNVEKGFNLITEFEVYGKVAKKEMINKLENMQKLDFKE